MTPGSYQFGWQATYIQSEFMVFFDLLFYSSAHMEVVKQLLLFDLTANVS